MKNSEKMSINITVFDNFFESETFGISPEDYFYFDDLLEGADAVFSEPKYDRPYEISDAYAEKNNFKIEVFDSDFNIRYVKNFSYSDGKKGVVILFSVFRGDFEDLAERGMIVTRDFEIDGRGVYFLQRFVWGFENWQPEEIALYDAVSDEKIVNIYSIYPKIKP